MSTSNDELRSTLERIEIKLDKLAEKVDQLESERDQRKGAKAAMLTAVGLVTGTGLWAWLTEIFKHGGK